MFVSRARSLGNVARMIAKKQFNPIALRTIVSIEEAKKMPKNYNEIPNDILLNMAVMGDQEAREERLIREIMAVDNVTW